MSLDAASVPDRIDPVSHPEKKRFGPVAVTGPTKKIARPGLFQSSHQYHHEERRPRIAHHIEQGRLDLIRPKAQFPSHALVIAFVRGVIGRLRNILRPNSGAL